MQNDELTRIDQEIIAENYAKAEELLLRIDGDKLPKPLKLKFFFLLAKTNFELDKNDLVMPFLNNVLSDAREYPEIDRAYLLAATWNMDEALKREEPEKKNYLHDAEHFFDKIASVQKLNTEDQLIYYYQKGILELQLIRLESSVTNFEKALTISDSMHSQRVLHSYLANTYRSLQQFEKAIQHYDLEIKNTPTTDEKAIAFAQISKARILDTIGEIEEATTIILDVLKKFDIGKEKEDSEITMYCYDVLADTCYSLHKYSDSLNHLNKALGIAVATGNDLTDYLYQISKMYRKLKDYENAEKKAKEALKVTKNDIYIQMIYQELYQINKEAEKYDQAIESLETLLEKYPNYDDLAWANYCLGHIHSLQGDYNTAISYFQKTLKIRGPKGEYYIASLDYMAYCYLKSDDIDRAMEICLDTIENNPKSPELAWTHAVLARCYFEKGMKTQAMDEVTKAQRFKPKSSEVYMFAERVLKDTLKDLGIE